MQGIDRTVELAQELGLLRDTYDPEPQEFTVREFREECARQGFPIADRTARRILSILFLRGKLRRRRGKRDNRVQWLYSLAENSRD